MFYTTLDMTGKWVEDGTLWTQCGYGFKLQQCKEADWNSRRNVEAGECRIGALWREEDCGAE